MCLFNIPFKSSFFNSIQITMSWLSFILNVSFGGSHRPNAGLGVMSFERVLTSCDVGFDFRLHSFFLFFLHTRCFRALSISHQLQFFSPVISNQDLGVFNPLAPLLIECVQIIGKSQFNVHMLVLFCNYKPFQKWLNFDGGLYLTMVFYFVDKLISPENFPLALNFYCTFISLP